MWLDWSICLVLGLFLLYPVWLDTEWQGPISGDLAKCVVASCFSSPYPAQGSRSSPFLGIALPWWGNLRVPVTWRAGLEGALASALPQFWGERASHAREVTCEGPDKMVHVPPRPTNAFQVEGLPVLSVSHRTSPGLIWTLKGIPGSPPQQVVPVDLVHSWHALKHLDHITSFLQHGRFSMLSLSWCSMPCKPGTSFVTALCTLSLHSASGVVPTQPVHTLQFWPLDWFYCVSNYVHVQIGSYICHCC